MATKLVSLHDTKAAAEAARRNLMNAGIDEIDITIDDADSLGSAGPEVFKSLYGDDLEEYEANTYSRAVKGGHKLLTAHVDDKDAAKALHVMSHHKNVDLKAKAVKEGVLSAKAAATVAVPTYKSDAEPIEHDLGGPEALKLAEEHIHVDKKVVETGTTQVRRYTVEKPVTATVKLRDEHVRLVKKALDDPNVDDIDWGDATIELRSTKEVPYVTKSAKIVAEVGLEQVAREHTETIHDTERRERYEVITDAAEIEKAAKALK